MIGTIKRTIFNVSWSLGYVISRRDAPPPPHYLQQEAAYADLIARVTPFTMTSWERMAALVDATRYVVDLQIPGAIVECGVWRGGSMMLVALTLMEKGDLRDLYLFDTFAGMTTPTAVDVDWRGQPAKKQFEASQAQDHNEWCFASLEEVRRNLLSTGYPPKHVHLVKGDVLETIPHQGLEEIAILRLDTDWYKSTLHELTHLYPKVRPGGIVIIDDFGHWQGCRKAVEAYFAEGGPFLARIDQMGRLAVKPSNGAGLG